MKSEAWAIERRYKWYQVFRWCDIEHILYSNRIEAYGSSDTFKSAHSNANFCHINIQSLTGTTNEITLRQIEIVNTVVIAT